jgi:hypothetical protein
MAFWLLMAGMAGGLAGSFAIAGVLALGHRAGAVLRKIVRDAQRRATMNYINFLGAVLVVGPSVGLISGQLPLNSAVGWIAIGLLISIFGIEHSMRSLIQSVRGSG